VVLRTLWQIKSLKQPQGEGKNAGPDFQELLVGSELVLFCDSGDEPAPGPSLEVRVARALREPSSVDRFGGWSLGESTHLVNDAGLLADANPGGPCVTFLTDHAGTVTMPVWVDHVGSAGTRYAVGRLERISASPSRDRLPQVPLDLPPLG